MQTKPTQPKPLEPAKPFVVIDKALSGIPQFPSTANQSQVNFENFLNAKASEGLLFRGVVPQNVGAELRYLLVFEKG